MNAATESSTGRLSALAGPLLAWYERHGRHDLPWQTPRTPYRVWVSEIMLQQTQVATVIPYFHAFMQRFSDVHALAAASEDDVMAHWAGLGYYARARNLRAAAHIIVRDHGGKLPPQPDVLETLPGIGRSTAGAIASLAFNRHAAMLDGNAKRVYARYFGVPGWPGETRIEKRLWAYAEQHTPASRPADYTQAIMDLGATVCTRKRPACDECPLAADCRALAEDAVECYPYPRPGRKRGLRHTRMLILVDHQQRVLLEKRPPTGIWGGLWSLPEVPDGADPAAHSRHTLKVDPGALHQQPGQRHGFTHFELDITPLRATAAPVAGVGEGAGRRWCRLDDLPALPAPINRILQATKTHLEKS